MNNKIIHIDNLESIKSENIIFVSGVFDILHLGHITFFRKAKEQAEKHSKSNSQPKLVIALHDDESVKKHKGKNRPFMTLEERSEILSELQIVDYVIPWQGWENIVDLVLDLKPNYLAITDKSFDNSKKGEWKGDSWEEIAKQIGAEIIKVSVLKDYASSKIINLIDHSSHCF